MRILPVLLFLSSITFQAYSFEAYISRNLIQSIQPLTVGDIVSVYPDDKTADFNKELPPLGSRPALLSIREIEGYVKSTGSNSAVLIGKRPVYLPGEITSNREKIFYEELMGFLRSIFPDSNERLEITPLNNLEFKLLDEKHEYSFSVEEMNSGFMRIRWSTPGGREYTETVQYSRKVPVYVSKKYISSGTEFNENSLHVKFMKREYISDLSDLVQTTNKTMFAMKNIQSGTPLLKEHITAKEMVRKGESVSIIVKRGALQLRFEGRTLEAAPVGSLVRVKPYRGTREIAGILVEKDEVSVD